MSWMRGNVTDDAGTLVSLYRNYASDDWTKAYPQAPAKDHFSSLRHRRYLLALGCGIVVIPVLIGVCTYVFLTAFPGFISWGFVSQCVFFGIIMLSISVSTKLIGNKMNAHETKLACVGDRRCAACSYELCDVPVEDDGKTICPECACVWQLEREQDA